MTTHTARLRAPADFGLALQQARLARGLTQSQVAAELDVPQGAVSAIESGQTTIFLRRLLEPARRAAEPGMAEDAGVGGDRRGVRRERDDRTRAAGDADPLLHAL